MSYIITIIICIKSSYESCGKIYSSVLDGSAVCLRAVPTRATYNRPSGITRFPSADSPRGNTIGGQILNMFNTESRPTVQRIGLRLWRICRRFYYPHTHTPIVKESVLESVLESADYSSKSADSNADSPKVGLWGP